MALAQWTNDQVFNQLNSGLKWSGSTITYAFATNAAGISGGEAGFSPLSAAAQTSAKLALAVWDDLILPDMQQVLNPTSFTSANIEFGMSTSVGYGLAYFPSVGSVWFNSAYTSGGNSLTSPTVGRHGFMSYAHEIGHALGLDHMGAYDGSGNWTPSSYQDSTVYSIMSYFGPNWSAGAGSVAWADWVGADGVLYSPQTPMLNDIYAIQRIYGTETTTRVGDTIYGFNSNITDATAAIYNFAQNKNPILTLFDSGGTDTLDLSGWNTPSVINLAPGSFSSCASMTNNIAIAYSCDIENAIGGGGADTISGNTLNNHLAGGAGDDTIYALSGNDVVIGGLGNDTIDGGDGTDYVHLEGTWDSLSYELDQVSGYLTISSSTNGTDRIKNVEYYRDSNNVVKSYTDLTGLTFAPPAYSASVSIAPSAVSQKEGSGAATAYRFTVTLSEASTASKTVDWSLAFGSGAGQADATDFSGPLSGTVSFAAGQTTASIVVSVVGDSNFESDEAFRILLSNPASGLTLVGPSAIGTIGNDDLQNLSLDLTGTAVGEIMNGSANGDTIRAMGGHDTLYGGAGNDLLDGGAGNDKMFGGLGDDIFLVDSKNDTAVEYAGQGLDTVRTTFNSYQLAGEIERLEFAGSGAFVGYGNVLDNIIVGGAGADLLNGGLGNDTLTGGAGADRFGFNSALGPKNSDTITDFSVAEDKIQLENAIFTALKSAGTLAAGAFNTGAAATQADDRIIYDSNSGALFYDADGTGSAAAVQFGWISPYLNLTNLNFQVI
jgi:serralysin